MSKYFGVGAVAALLAAAAVFLLMRGGGGRTEVIVTVEEIKEIAQLSTVEYVMSEVLHKELGKAWYEWRAASFLARVRGKIRGSVDLDKMQVEVVNNGGQRRVSVRFEPGAVVIHPPEISQGDIEIIDCANPNVLHPISAADHSRAVDTLIAHLRSVAESHGIKERTAAEAKLVLTRFLEQLGFEAHIEFAEAKLQAATAAAP